MAAVEAALRSGVIQFSLMPNAEHSNLRAVGHEPIKRNGPGLAQGDDQFSNLAMPHSADEWVVGEG